MASTFRVGGIVLIALLFVNVALIKAEPKGTAVGKQPRVQKFDEVERGFWIRSFFGVSVTTQNPFVNKSRKNPAWPPGGTFGLELGYDFGQIASVHLAARGMYLNGYLMVDGEKTDIGSDVGVYIASVGTRVNISTTKRFAWFVKAGAGYLVALPEKTTLDDGLAVQAGTGIEYATKLRHFFVGLEVAADLLSNLKV